MTVTVQVSNLKGGNARGVVVDQILLRTLLGIGRVTLVNASPIVVGDIAAGQSTNVVLTLNVPVGVPLVLDYGKRRVRRFRVLRATASRRGCW